MKKSFLFLCATVCATLVYAHPGGLDSKGCHTNHKTGEYHCHGTPKSSSPDPAPSSSSSTTKSSTSISSATHFSSSAEGSFWLGNVSSISDGDTITVTHDGAGEKIRLFGIDCPEGSQPFSEKATAFTSELVLKKLVAVHPINHDQYGRTVARVFQNGTDIQEALVKAGLAWWFEKYDPKDTQLSQLQEKARTAKLGLWAEASPIAPWDWRRSHSLDSMELNFAATPETPAKKATATASAEKDQTVYVTKTGTKYHRAGCRFLKSSAIAMNLSEAKGKYSPCSVCNPPH